MIRIQLVDDEPFVLSALKRLLKPRRWEIDTFENASEALEALLTNEYSVIVSDYQMPVMDGVTYLQFAKQRQPNAVRLILSAHGDRNSMMKAINQAEIYRFVSKPWEEYEIETAIRSAVDLSRLRTENQRLLEEVRAKERKIRQRDDELSRLESAHPGITRVVRDSDGSILIQDTE